MSDDWRVVQLPRKLVDKVEAIANDPESNYRNVSDFISSVTRERLERMQSR